MNIRWGGVVSFLYWDVYVYGCLGQKKLLIFSIVNLRSGEPALSCLSLDKLWSEQRCNIWIYLKCPVTSFLTNWHLPASHDHFVWVPWNHSPFDSSTFIWLCCHVVCQSDNLICRTFFLLFKVLKLCWSDFTGLALLLPSFLICYSNLGIISCKLNLNPQ